MSEDELGAVLTAMCEDFYQRYGDSAEKKVFDAIMRGYVMTRTTITNKESELLTEYISKTIQRFRDEDEK